MVEVDQDNQQWLGIGENFESSVTDHDNNSTVVIDQPFDFISEVTIGTMTGVTVPAHIGSRTCHALIGTGATNSGMSESCYQTVMLSYLTKKNHIIYHYGLFQEEMYIVWV